MRFRKVIFAVILTLLSSAGQAFAQTVVNPDISAVGDTRIILRNLREARFSEEDQVSFRFEELELVFSGYLNPFARADVFLALEGGSGPASVEEASTTVLRGLPLALQIKAGKYLLDIGKINTQHPHQWSWLERPLMHRLFLSDEGASVIGLQASTFQPLGESALTVSLNAMKSSFFRLDSALDGTDTSRTGSPEKVAFSTRASLFSPITDFTSLEAGLSFFRGYHDPASSLIANLACLDFKLKWRPDMYRSFVFILETMLSRRHSRSPAQGISTISASGLFSSFEVKWRRRFDAGAFLDYGENPLVRDESARAFGISLGFMPAEETSRFSIVWRREASWLHRGIHNSITLQFLWSLGPHKPHPF